VQLTKEENIKATRQHLGKLYEKCHFLNSVEAERAQARRDELLASVVPRLRSSFMGSKLHLGGLSQGCRLCGQGVWSCLYINFQCNADCFFCPGAGYKDSVDSGARADDIRFKDETEYSDYVIRFGISAVSFSGGEPLLNFGRLLRYLRQLRHRHGDGLYIWLYTNGLAVTKEKLVQLQSEGLDEIRFNICAANYELDKLSLASKIIDTVTVEIPVIPEDCDKVQKMLLDLKKRGVKYLHLHQLMAIGANWGDLLFRGYTFAHGLTPPVVASELAALELMQSALDKGLDLPVQYCSWVYKSRWHVRSQDSRITAMIKYGYESETQSGLLRKTWIEAGAFDPGLIVEKLEIADPKGDGWNHNREEGRFYIQPWLIPLIPYARRVVDVAYFKPEFAGSEPEGQASATIEQRDIHINEHKQLCVRLQQVSNKITLEAEETEEFLDAYLRNGPVPRQSKVAALAKFEQVEYGLPEYY